MEHTKKRPIEIITLLNPAFCGQTIRYCIRKYEKKNSLGMPYSLVFFVLPLVLHKETRDKIPSISRKPFHAWLNDNQTILIGLAERIKQLVPITKDSISFLVNCNAIKIENARLKVIEFNSKPFEITSLEIQDCFQKAETVGRWFASAGTTSTIYSILGVQP